MICARIEYRNPPADILRQLAEQFEGNLLLACTELGLVLDAGQKASSDANANARIIDSLDCHVTMMLKQITI